MPVLHAQSLGYQFKDGRVLFENISITLDKKVSALIGRNGIGKSILAKILAGYIDPNHGTVFRPPDIGYYHQSTLRQTAEKHQTVAELLEVEDKLAALSRVERGECYANDYDIIGDDWLLAEQLNTGIQSLGIDTTLSASCSCLSGGQRSLLRLWYLLQGSYDLLILDEPSNHLDGEAKNWLLNAISDYQGTILLISHDRQLLTAPETFFAMTTLGLERFNGCYEQFEQQQSLNCESLARRQKNIERQKHILLKQQQASRTSAERRRRQGKKLRTTGSQAKSLLDKKKNAAESAMSSRNAQRHKQQQNLRDELSEIKTKQEHIKPQALSIEHSNRSHTQLLTLQSLVIPFINHPYEQTKSISKTINFGQKVHLRGRNGTGKSTFLKVLSGHLKAQSGSFHARVSFSYLDQHFSLLQRSGTVLENFIRCCPHCSPDQSRLLLASGGFRGDQANSTIDNLSGGEKMRLAMLMVSHQPGETLLLLDEPDNHLDLDSKKQLAAALKNYQGSYILVSHDPYFVNEAGVNDVLDL